MLPLSVLFTSDERELQALFSGLDLAELGVTFGDGTTAESINGSLIYRGAAFDYAITDAANATARYHIFCADDVAAMGSSLRLGLGGSIASGQCVPTIVKALLSLGEALGAALGAKTIFWQPALVMAGFGYYAETIIQYDQGAAFPSLVMIGFDTSSEPCIQTEGLAWLCGQELQFERGDLSVNEAMRYVVRIVHDLATNGAVKSETEVPGMDDGERLVLSPDKENKLLIVRQKHRQNGVTPVR